MIRTPVNPAKMQFLCAEVRKRTVSVVTFRLPGQPRVCEYVADREEAKAIYQAAVEQLDAKAYEQAWKESA